MAITSVAGRRPAVAHTDAYRLMRGYLVAMLVVVLDVAKFLDKGNVARYALLFVPIGVAFLARYRHVGGAIRRLQLGDKILLALALIGGAGSLYGRLFLGTTSTALPIFVPMSIAFLYLLMLREPTEREVYQVLIAIGAIGLLYVTMNAVANSGLAPGLAASRTYRNADVMYIPLGFVALWTARRALASMAVVALGAFVFVTYPSATSALVALATAVTLFVTKPKGGRARLHLVAIVVLAGLVASIFFFGRAVEFGNEYFQVVGKKDNSNTRLALWQAGLEHFASSPIVGDVFSGETTVLVFRQSGGGAPFHNPYNNDYILFLASGGVLMFALLVWWIVWVERTAVRRYRGFLAGGQLSRAALMRALLVAFNAWFVAAAFNPLFSGMGRTVTLFSIYAMMMALGTPAVAAATAASSVREPALASARG